ncbi:hypothetical protein pb186bvf_012921 [Paramecium bursaria]
MSNYQDLLFQTHQLSKDVDQDDLLLSMTDSNLLFRSADSARMNNKKKIFTQIPLRQTSVNQEDSPLKKYLEKETTQKKSQFNQELHLLQANQQLKKQVQKQQQEFYQKELEFQQKLLQAQKEYETMLELNKTKYELIIQDLRQKLDGKNKEIIQISSLFQNLQTESQTNRPTAKKLLMTESIQQEESEVNRLNGLYTARVYSAKPFYQAPQIQENKLLMLYRQEIDKIKQQTLEFEMKFESEKKNIKQEISLLKNQKAQLQSIICQKSDKYSVIGQEKSNRSKRESQSIRAFSHKSKKSFEF